MDTRQDWIEEIYEIARGLAPIDVVTCKSPNPNKDKIFRMAHLASALSSEISMLKHRLQQLQIQTDNLKDYAKYKGIEKELKVYRNVLGNQWDDLTEDELAAGEASWAMGYSDD